MGSTNVKTSSEMPEPQVMNYWKFYMATPVLYKDLNTVLGEIAYVDAIQFFDFLKENNDELSAAQLNEFIRKLGCLPYKYVKDIMGVLGRKEGLGAYFTEFEKNPNEVDTTKKRNA